MGKLNFAARVVFGGRRFLRRMIDTVNTLRRPHHHIHRTAEIKADLLWWAEFLSVFNGTRFFVDSEPMDVDEFSTEACALGAGGSLRGDCSISIGQSTVKLWLKPTSIYKRLTCPCGTSIQRWKQELSGQWLTVRNDNVITVSVINKGSHTIFKPCSGRARSWLSATHNFHLTARYISSRENTIADALSCLQDPSHSTRFLSRVDNTWRSLTIVMVTRTWVWAFRRVNGLGSV